MRKLRQFCKIARETNTAFPHPNDLIRKLASSSDLASAIDQQHSPKLDHSVVERLLRDYIQLIESCNPASASE
jgi:hypothetical protein